MKNVFIIGSKGIPANYGGFETFVDKLTEKRVSSELQYHVACLGDNEEEFTYNNCRCFNVCVKDIGSAKAITYDIKALKMCVDYIEKNNLKDCIIYILACRIGPFLYFYKKKLKKMGIQVFVNPDGHEWKRSKWNGAIKKYWKISERLMVSKADLLVCDSKGIEKYIHEDYKKYKPKTTFIAYGADINKSKVMSDDEKLLAWYKKHDIKPNEFYLIVGRFVPENNYETVIREFMKSSTTKDLVIITNVEENSFYLDLKARTKFDIDKRIKFVGTLYDQELIKKVREDAYGYIHGHEVGGTNPSLLEALASTKLNLLLDVVFNQEVGKDGAMYFSKVDGNLSGLIHKCDIMGTEEIDALAIKAKKRISEHYSWDNIVSMYENLFLKGC